MYLQCNIVALTNKTSGRIIDDSTLFRDSSQKLISSPFKTQSSFKEGVLSFGQQVKSYVSARDPEHRKSRSRSRSLNERNISVSFISDQNEKEDRSGRRSKSKDKRNLRLNSASNSASATPRGRQV